MNHLIFRLLILLKHVPIIHAITIQPQLPTSETSPNLIIPTNLTTPLPPAPPGYHLEISYNPLSPLNPLAVYHSTILTLYLISNNYTWSAPWSEPKTPFTAGWHIWILVQKKSGRRLPLFRTSHVALGIYHGVLKMAQDSEFCQMMVECFVDGRVVGNVTIEKLPVPVPATMEDGLPSSLPISVDDNDDPSPLPTTSNPQDPPPPIPLSSPLTITLHSHDLILTYTYTTPTSRINSRDLFTSLLTGLLIASAAGRLAPCRTLDAVSAEANLVFHVNGLEDSPQVLRYDVVTLGMKMLWGDMTFQQRRFEEVEFGFRYQGVEVGEGYVRRLGPRGGGMVGGGVGGPR